MKTSSIAALAIGIVVLLGAAALIAFGLPGRRAAPPPDGVTAAEFTLRSTAVELPVDEQLYPDGPHADIVNANCASCHSASMVLTQPPLSTEQWKAEVTKMREVYKAPVAEADVPAIVAYLTNLSAAQERN